MSKEYDELQSHCDRLNTTWTKEVEWKDGTSSKNPVATVTFREKETYCRFLHGRWTIRLVSDPVSHSYDKKKLTKGDEEELRDLLVNAIRRLDNHIDHIRRFEFNELDRLQADMILRDKSQVECIYNFFDKYWAIYWPFEYLKE
jgi:hypothetical protein